MTVVLGSEAGSPTSRRRSDHDSTSAAEAVAALRSPPHSSAAAAAELIEATPVTPNGDSSALRVSASDMMPESNSQVFLLDDMA